MSEGRFHDIEHNAVETTYVIRMPEQHAVLQKPESGARNYAVHVLDGPQGYVDYGRPLPETRQFYTPLQLPRPQFLYHTFYEPSWDFQTPWDGFYGTFGMADETTLHDVSVGYNEIELIDNYGDVPITEGQSI